jgi:hypothetical protein
VGRALVELLTANFTPEVSNWAAAVELPDRVLIFC